MNLLTSVVFKESSNRTSRVILSLHLRVYFSQTATALALLSEVPVVCRALFALVLSVNESVYLGLLLDARIYSVQHILTLKGIRNNFRPGIQAIKYFLK